MLRKSILILLAVLVFGEIEMKAQQFSDFSDQCGLPVFTSDSYLGSGLSFIDFDQDGWDDLTYGTVYGDSIMFYHNNQGVFERVMLNIIDTHDTKSVLWFDYDNDGDPDLIAGNYGPLPEEGGQNRLYRNDGNLSFTDVTASSGLVQVNDRTYSITAGDINKDGFLDIYVSNRETINPNYFYINNGDGTYTEVGEQYNVTGFFEFTFIVAFFDYDKDGWQDLYMINDFETIPNRLFRNKTTHFELQEGSGAEIMINAMNAGVGDYNKDLFSDVYVTNSPPSNVLLANDGGAGFVDVTDSTGTVFGNIGWGGNFFDKDNDGDLDLYVTAMEAVADHPNTLYENTGAPNYVFDEIFLSGDTLAGQCNAIGDVDKDGNLDFITYNIFGHHSYLYRNNLDGNNWIKFKMKGTLSNRDGIGSKLYVYYDGNTSYHEVMCGEAYLAQNSYFQHFGLNDASQVDSVRVDWLSGVSDLFLDLDANQDIILIENSTIAPPQTVTGLLTDLFGNPVEGAIIELSGEYSDTDTSDVAGEFTSDVPDFASVSFRPEADFNYTQGLSIVDLIRIQQHIALINPLDNPYQHIAADANHDNDISVVDLVQFMSLLVGNIAELPDNDSYRFVPEDYVWDNPDQPLSEDFPEEILLLDISSPESINFKAIKLGNVLD